MADPLYTQMGKQVLCAGAHYADAVNGLAAEIIVGALECHPVGTVPVLVRREAEQVAEGLRAKLPTLTGAKGLPLAEDDPAWTDIVLFVLRRSVEQVAGRGA